MKPLVSLEDLMWKHFPEQEYQVDKLIPAGSITILTGQPRAYKTWVLLDTAICVASGQPLFGHFQTDKTGVLIIDEESGERLLQKRLFMLQATADLPIWVHSYGGFTLTDEKTVDEVLALCEIHDIKLVIFDSLIRIHAADENKSGEMAVVFKHLRRLSAKGITVLIAHHHRKSASPYSNDVGQEMRGSSDILASVDCHIALKRNESQLTVHQTKQRYDQELEPFVLSVETDGKEYFRFQYAGEPVAPKDANAAVIKAAVINLLGQFEVLNQSELLAEIKAAGVKVNENKLRAILNAMVEDGEIDCTPGKANTKHYSLNLGVDNA